MDQVGTRATPRLDLGAAMLEYVEQPEEFITTKVLPIFKTPKKKANYPAITRESLTQKADTKRGSGGNYNRGSIGQKDKSFSCEERGFEIPLADDDRALFKTDFDAELASAKAATRIVKVAQEVRTATLVFNTSTFTGAALYTDNSGAPWDNIASDVIAHVRAAKRKVRTNCGLIANALILSDLNIDRLKASTVIKDAIKYVARLTDAELRNALADLLGVKYIIEATAIYNSSKKLSGFVSADIWSDDYAMIARVVEKPDDLTDPGLGRTFLWTEDCPENVFVEEYRDEPIRSDVFRSRQHTDEVLIDPYFGHLIKVDA